MSKRNSDLDTKGMIPESTVRFDPVRKANFHLDRNGNPIYHGCPEGFEFDVKGSLIPKAIESISIEELATDSE